MAIKIIQNGLSKKNTNRGPVTHSKDSLFEMTSSQKQLLERMSVISHPKPILKKSSIEKSNNS